MICKTCGEPGDGGGTMPECCNCWEIEKRLERYLRSITGQAFAATALAIALVRAASVLHDRP